MFQQFNFSFMLTLKQFPPPYKALYNSPSFFSVHDFFSLSRYKKDSDKDYCLRILIQRKFYNTFVSFSFFCHKRKRG